MLYMTVLSYNTSFLTHEFLNSQNYCHCRCHLCFHEFLHSRTNA